MGKEVAMGFRNSRGWLVALTLALIAVHASAYDNGRDDLFGDEDADRYHQSCQHGGKWFSKLMGKMGKMANKMRTLVKDDPYLAQHKASDWHKAGNRAKAKMAKYSNKLHRALMKAQKCTGQFPKDAQPGKVRKLADEVYQLFSIFGRGQQAYNIVDGSSSLAQAVEDLHSWFTAMERQLNREEPADSIRTVVNCHELFVRAKSYTMQLSSAAGTSHLVTCLQSGQHIQFTTRGPKGGLKYLRVLPKTTDLHGSGGRWTKFAVNITQSGALVVQNVPTGQWLTVAQDGVFASHKLPQQLIIKHAAAAESKTKKVGRYSAQSCGKAEADAEEEEEEPAEEEEEGRGFLKRMERFDERLKRMEHQHDEDEDEDEDRRRDAERHDEDKDSRSSASTATPKESGEAVKLLSRIVKLMHARMDGLEAKLQLQAAEREHKHEQELAALWKLVDAGTAMHTAHQTHSRVLTRAVRELEQRAAPASAEQELMRLRAAAKCLSSKTDVWCEATKSCRDLELLAFESPESCPSGWITSPSELKTHKTVSPARTDTTCPAGYAWVGANILGGSDGACLGWLVVAYWLVFMALAVAAMHRSFHPREDQALHVPQPRLHSNAASGELLPDALPKAAVVTLATGLPSNSTDTAAGPNKDSSEPMQATAVRTVCSEEPVSPVGCNSEMQQLLSMGFDREAIEHALLVADGDMSVAAAALVNVTEQTEAWETEWDLLLHELQEMGFGDEDANKHVIRATAGNLKNAVQALVHEERQQANAMLE